MHWSIPGAQLKPMTLDEATERFDLASMTREPVVFTQEHFVGVSPETGALLWSRPFTTQATTTSQTPILYGDMVIQNGRGNT